jgi:heterodisulfide reductase subunit A
LSELESVSGTAGDFTVTVKKNPRFVDMEKCIACGLCAEKCPKKVDDEHNAGISKRKAAYIKYGQTVPLSYALDPENCIYLQKGTCGVCAKVCPSDAINFNEKEAMLTLKVGALILAPGFQPFSPTNYDYTGYGVIPDVVTSMEYERLLSAGGPNMGHLMRPSDDAEPMTVAWLQCVGSRSINRDDKKYCSSVCCMYAIKQAGITQEHLPKGTSEQAIFNMDIRCHGKEFDTYYEEAKSKGVRFVKARPHTILPGPSGKGVRLNYAQEDGTMAEELFDMLVLSVGLMAQNDVEALAQVTGITLDEFRFAESTAGSPVETTVPGIYAVGSFRAPMGIPRAVTQASAAASDVSVLLRDARGDDAAVKTYPAERSLETEEPRIGVFVCSCGVNIAGVVDVAAVADYANTLAGWCMWRPTFSPVPRTPRPLSPTLLKSTTSIGWWWPPVPREPMNPCFRTR